MIIVKKRDADAHAFTSRTRRKAVQLLSNTLKLPFVRRVPAAS
jgi:hypothetical protein